MKTLLVGGSIIALITVCVIWVCYSFSKETPSTRDYGIRLNDHKETNYIDMYLKVTGVDPIHGDLSVRIELEPHGDLVDEKSRSLTRNITVYVPTATASGGKKASYQFEKNQGMTSFDINLSLHDGNSAHYPFDKYLAEVFIYAEESATAETGNELPNPVPVKAVFRGSIPGYDIREDTKLRETEPELVANSVVVYGLIKVNRSFPVIAFSVFIGIVMWGLAIAVLFLVLSIFFGERKVEIGMCGFMSALMFAFYGLRNGQPNVPPVGVFSDMACFFWAELIVASSLLFSIILWVFQKPNPNSN